MEKAVEAATTHPDEDGAREFMQRPRRDIKERRKHKWV